MARRSDAKYTGQQIEHVVCFHAAQLMRACTISSGFHISDRDYSIGAIMHYATNFPRLANAIRQCIKDAN